MITQSAREMLRKKAIWLARIAALYTATCNTLAIPEMVLQVASKIKSYVTGVNYNSYVTGINYNYWSSIVPGRSVRRCYNAQQPRRVRSSF